MRITMQTILALATLATTTWAAPIVYFRPKEMEPAPEGSPQLEAPGNWFSVNNEMKLLPEIASGLPKLTLTSAAFAHSDASISKALSAG